MCFLTKSRSCWVEDLPIKETLPLESSELLTQMNALVKDWHFLEMKTSSLSSLKKFV